MTFIRHDLPYDCLAFTGERAPWWGGDLQTMRNTLIGAKPDIPAGQDIIFDLPDGDKLLGAFHTPHKPNDSATHGIMVIIHGLAGDYDSSYVRHLTKAAIRQGYHALRLNLRGAGRGFAMARSSYHAGRSDDLAFVISAMAARYPDKPLYLCAFSLGGTMAVNMAARHALPKNLSAVISFCAPLDMLASAKRFHEPRNKLYNRHFTKNLITHTLARPHRDTTQDTLIKSVRSVREFDDVFTSKVAGYQNADAYYKGTTPLGYLSQIYVPTLLVHSDNDPLIPDSAYRTLHTSDKLYCVITKGGGHVGFHGRDQSYDCWQSAVALQFVSQVSQQPFKQRL